MNAEADFHAVCSAPSLEAALRALPGHRLAALLLFLKGASGGVRYLVKGAAQMEAAHRFTVHFTH